MINQKSDVLLSIVVPVYNTEEIYLRRCLGQFCANVQNVELIIVDDGSSESTRSQIMNLLNSVKTCSRLILKENGGQNSARQVGINAAYGQYILFLDSDDFIDLPALFHAIEVLRAEEPDVLGYRTKLINESGSVVGVWGQYGDGKSNPEKRQVIAASCTLFTQIVKKSLFEDCPLIIGPHVGEDLAGIVPVLAKANTVIAIPDELYGYCQRETSVTHKLSVDHIFDVIDAFNGMLVRLGPLRQKYEAEIDWLAILHIAYYGSRRVLASIGNDREARNRIFSYLNVTFPSWRSNLYMSEEIRKRGLAFWLLVFGHWKSYMVLRNFKQAFTKDNRMLEGGNHAKKSYS